MRLQSSAADLTTKFVQLVQLIGKLNFSGDHGNLDRIEICQTTETASDRLVRDLGWISTTQYLNLTAKYWRSISIERQLSGSVLVLAITDRSQPAGGDR